LLFRPIGIEGKFAGLQYSGRFLRFRVKSSRYSRPSVLPI
jgi:hypothetical protein